MKNMLKSVVFVLVLAVLPSILRAGELDELLKRAASHTQDNYEKLSKWSGVIRLVDKQNIGSGDALNPSGVNKDALLVTESLVEFYVDVDANSLYCKYEQQNDGKPIGNGIATRRLELAAILTPHEYLVSNPTSRLLTRWPAEKGVELTHFSTVIDPRHFFGSGSARLSHEFFNQLVRALQDGKLKNMTVKREGTKYVLQHTTPNGSVNSLTIEPDMGWNLTATSTVEGLNRFTVETRFEEIEGIWLPVEHHRKNLKNLGEVQFDRQVTVVSQAINAQAEPRPFDLAALSPEDGARLSDNISNAEFRILSEKPVSEEEYIKAREDAK